MFFPLTSLVIKHRQIDFSVTLEFLPRQPQPVHAQPHWLRGAVLAVLPAVEAKMESKWLGRFDENIATGRKFTKGRVSSPMPRRRFGPLGAVTLANCVEQFDGRAGDGDSRQFNKFGVRPQQRHRTAGRLAGVEFALGNGIGIPDLLGE